MIDGQCTKNAMIAWMMNIYTMLKRGLTLRCIPPPLLLSTRLLLEGYPLHGIITNDTLSSYSFLLHCHQQALCPNVISARKLDQRAWWQIDFVGQIWQQLVDVMRKLLFQLSCCCNDGFKNVVGRQKIEGHRARNLNVNSAVAVGACSIRSQCLILVAVQPSIWRLIFS